MRREGARLVFGVILHADEPRMALKLDRLGQQAIGRHAGEAHGKYYIYLYSIFFVNKAANKSDINFYFGISI